MVAPATTRSIMRYSTMGVTVDLAAETATGAQIGADTVFMIENVIGGFGNDTLTGDG